MMPFGGKDQRGRDNYDKNRSLMTTVNFEGAAALQIFADDIIGGKITGESAKQEVPCNQATLTMSWTKGQNGPSTTELTLNKNGQTISFTFATSVRTVMRGGQPVMEVTETGLKVFAATLAGYLTGINADRHLDKLTDEFAKSQENRSGGGGNWSGGGYQKGSYGGQGQQQQQSQTPAVDFSQFAVQG